MAKVKKKRKRLRIKRFLIFLLILGIFGIAIYSLLGVSINHITVKGNKVLEDQEVISLSRLSSHSSFLKTNTFAVRRKLLKYPLIKEAKVHRKLWNNIEISIKEKKILYYDEISKSVVLEDKQKIQGYEDLVPTLVGEIPSDKHSAFIKQMNKIDDSILREVSEIYYKPTEFDNDRFLLAMDDGNYVYLTLTKFKHLNYYDEMLPEFNGKKGILYLDSGNTFQIQE